MIKKINEYTFQIKFKYNIKDTIKLAWFADIHFDSHYTNRKLLKQHLNKCLETNTYIILGGDTLDLMQSKFDKRSNKTELMKEYKENDYVNKILEDVYKFLLPYKENILLLCRGNHDNSFLDKYGIDCIKLLGEKLNVEVGSYQNYIRLNFEDERGGGWKSLLIWHSHSSGSIGQRSKGVLSVDILAGQIDADIYITEHSHQTYIVPMSYERLDRFNKICYQDKNFLQVPTYEESWKNKNNWWSQTNKSIRPIGHYLITFQYDKEKKIKYNINFIN